ncbi:MAG TPA: DUF5985 family protein [Pseudoduganella sp.]
MMPINAWLSGAIFMAALVVALFFLRYWRHSRDKLFIYFALAFILEGVQRLLQVWPSEQADPPHYYLLRLLEYGLILYAVIQKNRKFAGD